MLGRPPRSIVDGLEILQELGGSASVAEIIEHTRTSSIANVHQRFRGLQRRGLVSVSGAGRPGDPYRFGLTKAGRLLAKHAAY